MHAKELGLDFVEFDLNPSEFWGCPLDEVTPKLGEIQAAMAETGVEVGAVGRWASHILDENGEVIEAEWSEVKRPSISVRRSARSTTSAAWLMCRS